MKTLRQSLIDCDMAMLRAIAEMHGLELGSNRQEEAVVQLAEELLQPEEVALTLESLSPAEQEALAAIIAQGGKIKALFSCGNMVICGLLGLDAWSGRSRG